MSIITRHRYLKIDKYTENADINFITYHKNTKHIQTYKTLDVSVFIDDDRNMICDQDKVLVFDRGMYYENIVSFKKIENAILNNSFSCKDIVRENLIDLLQKKQNLDFEEDRDLIIDNIQKSMSSNSNTQALKMYNNILKRLKFCCIQLFEKTDEQRKEIFDNSIVQRDEKIKKQKENENIIDELKTKKDRIKLNF